MVCVSLNRKFTTLPINSTFFRNGQTTSNYPLNLLPYFCGIVSACQLRMSNLGSGIWNHSTFSLRFNFNQHYSGIGKNQTSYIITIHHKSISFLLMKGHAQHAHASLSLNARAGKGGHLPSKKRGRGCVIPCLVYF